MNPFGLQGSRRARRLRRLLAGPSVVHYGSPSALFVLLCLTLSMTGCVLSSTTPRLYGTPADAYRRASAALPRPAHVVIVIEENKAYSQIIGNRHAPYINRLASNGALFIHAYAVAHPSEPNYLALFSGSTHGLISDSCPHNFSGANLASELRQAGDTFSVYSEGLPRVGFTGCRRGGYARKHNPAVNWQGANIKPSENQPFRNFPTHFNRLPTVALVIPNIDHDMHSASIQAGDRWLKRHMGRYARWAQRHNSVLIVTWDEDNDLHHNHIPTLVVGGPAEPGRYARQINHYSVLRTLEALYQLPLLGHSAQAVPITRIWR